MLLFRDILNNEWWRKAFTHILKSYCKGVHSICLWSASLFRTFFSLAHTTLLIPFLLTLAMLHHSLMTSMNKCALSYFFYFAFMTVQYTLFFRCVWSKKTFYWSMLLNFSPILLMLTHMCRIKAKQKKR